MTFKWSPEPDAPKAIKALRNFVSDEFDGTIIYPDLPSFREYTPDDVFSWVEEHGTKEQYKDLMNLYEKNAGMSMNRGATTLHGFLRENDAEWYLDNATRNSCIMGLKYHDGKPLRHCVNYCEKRPDDLLCEEAKRKGAITKTPAEADIAAFNNLIDNL